MDGTDRVQLLLFLLQKRHMRFSIRCGGPAMFLLISRFPRKSGVSTNIANLTHLMLAVYGTCKLPDMIEQFLKIPDDWGIDLTTGAQAWDDNAKQTDKDWHW
jgi:hypothetical protein